MKLAVAQEAIARTPHKDLKGGIYGTLAVRMKNSYAMAPHLRAYRQCMAAQLTGKRPGNLGDIQRAFKDAADKCATATRDIPKMYKPRSAGKLIAVQSRKIKSSSGSSTTSAKYIGPSLAGPWGPSLA